MARVTPPRAPFGLFGGRLPTFRECSDRGSPEPESVYRGRSPESVYRGEVPSLSIEGEVPSLSIEGEVPSLSIEGEVPSLSIEGEVPSLSIEGEVPSLSIEGEVPSLADWRLLERRCGNSGLGLWRSKSRDYALDRFAMMVHVRVFPPNEPAGVGAQFPDPRRAGPREILAVGADWSSPTLLAAYRSGIFPWPSSQSGRVPWCSPDPRAIFPLFPSAKSKKAGLEPPGSAPPFALHWSRSLRRTLRQHPFRVSLDEDLPQVMKACGDARPEGTWITADMMRAYIRLHELGWVHSVEVWDGAALVGGIYGLALGSLFAGESMFHAVTDASKIAFATLAESLVACRYTLFDVQVMNPHLLSLGCVEIRRADYLDRLASALESPALPLELASNLGR